MKLTMADPGFLPPPIRQWRVRNFKSIKRATVEFAPLTLVMGSNSSGKSSLLQSILLLSQAAQSRQLGDSLPLNGPLVSLGGFADVLSAWSDRKEIELGATISRFPLLVGDTGFTVRRQLRRRFPPHRAEPHEVARELIDSIIQWDLTLKGRTKAQSGSANIDRITLSSDLDPKMSLRARLSRTTAADEDAYQSGLAFGRSAYTAASQFTRGGDFSLNYRGYLRSPQLRRSTPLFGLLLRAGIPLDALVQEDEARLMASEWVEGLLRNARMAPPRREVEAAPSPVREGGRAGRQEIAVDSESLMTRLANIGSQEIQARMADPAVRAHPLYRAPEWMDSSLQRFLRSLLMRPGPDLERLLGLIVETLKHNHPVYVSHAGQHDPEFWEFSQDLLTLLRDRVLYLGPLRQDPQVVYKTLPAVGTGSLGSKGELTAAVLEAFADQMVVCPSPDGAPSRTSLKNAVDEWMHRLGVAERVKVSGRGAMGLAIEVDRPGPSGGSLRLDLTNVGVGVSQLLPVVVMSLLATPGSILLLEQPELHLHPAVQQRLGDFFIAVARSGRQLIVESHSEYLLNRLRLRIAQDTEDRLGQLIAILFAEFTESGTRFTPVTPNKYGTLEEWPDGFFDQAPRESAEILRAALSKQRARG